MSRFRGSLSSLQLSSSDNYSSFFPRIDSINFFQSLTLCLFIISEVRNILAIRSALLTDLLSWKELEGWRGSDQV